MIDRRERRKYHRTRVSLPLEYRITNAPYAHGGLVVNASEGGFLIESVKDMPVDTQLVMVVLFPRVYQLASFEVKAEIIWKARHYDGDWKGWQYGLRAMNMLNDDRQNLTQLLRGGFSPEENQVCAESPSP